MKSKQHISRGIDQTSHIDLRVYVFLSTPIDYSFFLLNFMRSPANVGQRIPANLQQVLWDFRERQNGLHKNEL